jgi:hypothetical protein
MTSITRLEPPVRISRVLEERHTKRPYIWLNAVVVNVLIIRFSLERHAFAALGRSDVTHFAIIRDTFNGNVVILIPARVCLVLQFWNPHMTAFFVKVLEEVVIGEVFVLLKKWFACRLSPRARLSITGFAVIHVHVFAFVN